MNKKEVDMKKINEVNRLGLNNRNEKEENVGHLIRQKPSKKLVRELDKCVLLCANCHAIVEHTDEDLTALSYS